MASRTMAVKMTMRGLVMTGSDGRKHADAARRHELTIRPDRGQAFDVLGTAGRSIRQAYGWRVLDRLDVNSSTCLLRH